MRSILAAKPNYLGHRTWANVLKPNEANSGDRMSAMQLRTEARREFALHYFGIDPKVREDAPADRALNNRKSHFIFSLKVALRLNVLKGFAFAKVDYERTSRLH